jgi:hypothetical protein
MNSDPNPITKYWLDRWKWVHYVDVRINKLQNSNNYRIKSKVSLPHRNLSTKFKLLIDFLHLKGIFCVSAILLAVHEI